MPNSKIDKIIQIIRENMVANAPGTQGDLVIHRLLKDQLPEHLAGRRKENI